jgi:hypothetical protein
MMHWRANELDRGVCHVFNLVEKEHIIATDLFRRPTDSYEAILDRFYLVDANLVGEVVKDAKHCVKHPDDLHPVALGANVQEGGDVVEHNRDHLKDLKSARMSLQLN